MGIAAPRRRNRWWYGRPALPAPQRRVFVTWQKVATMLVLLCIAAICLPKLADWTLCKAALRGSAACGGAIAEKLRLIVLGRYPYPRQWRTTVTALLLLGGRGARAIHRCRHWIVAALWVVTFACFGLRAHFTTTVPTIFGCSEQKYG